MRGCEGWLRNPSASSLYRRSPLTFEGVLDRPLVMGAGGFARLHLAIYSAHTREISFGVFVNALIIGQERTAAAHGEERDGANKSSDAVIH